MVLVSFVFCISHGSSLLFRSQVDDPVSRGIPSTLDLELQWFAGDFPDRSFEVFRLVSARK